VTENPLADLLNGSLAECDFGVMKHGFLSHGRDYCFVIQDSLCRDPGTYELTFTHVSTSTTRRVSQTRFGKSHGRMNSRITPSGRSQVSPRVMFSARTGPSHIPGLAFCDPAMRLRNGQNGFSVRCIRLVLRPTDFASRSSSVKSVIDGFH
jgi:hypothetical protein